MFTLKIKKRTKENKEREASESELFWFGVEQEASLLMPKRASRGSRSRSRTVKRVWNLHSKMNPNWDELDQI